MSDQSVCSVARDVAPLCLAQGVRDACGQSDMDTVFGIRDASGILSAVVQDHPIIGKARELSFFSEGYS